MQDPRFRGMTWIEGGEFAMGSADFYPEEEPVHQVAVSGFWIDRQPVTIADFRRFVKATGHVTNAERTPDAAEYPDADPDLLVPGSLVFQQTQGPVDLSDYRNWWVWMPGADWRHPEGPGSSITGRERHPVTHVAHEDAAAYAQWTGRELSTEAEWEFAARGGLDQKVYCWGDEFTPRGKQMANTWQGEFPWKNLKPPTSSEPRRCACTRRTDTGCTTWPGTCGSGRAISTRPVIRARSSTRAARRKTRE